MKRITPVLKGFLVFGLVLEILCWIFPYSHRGNHATEYQAILDRIAMKKVARVGHPYFGTVFRTDIKVNNMGFTSPVDYPYKPKPDEFVVGILGGSVAHDFAVDVPEEFALLLKQKNPKALKDKKVIILNLAVHGFKQPQQFFVASYFSPYIHMAVNLDGYNELYEGDPNFPVDYPTNSRFFSISSLEKARELYFAGVSYDLQKKIAKFPLTIPGLNFSQSYHRLWAVVDQKIENNVNKVVNHFGEARRESHPMQAKIAAWGRYTSDQATFLRAKKIPAFFFIQPNQYDRGSKVLSDQELRSAYKGPNETLAQWYNLLRVVGVTLKENGVNLTDLTKVFSGSNETIYIDDCCHVNHKGNLLMAEAMSAQIKIP